VAVLLPLPLAGPYDYRVPAGLILAAGDFVSVPLGRRKLVGVVWGAAKGGFEGPRLKSVDSRLDLPPLPAISRRLVDWVAAYTLSASGAVLRMVMSVPKALEPPPSRLGYVLAPVAPAELRDSAARRKVLEVAGDGEARPAAELARAAGVGAAVVKGLAEAGALLPVALAAGRTQPVPDPDSPGPILSEGQAAAAQALVASLDGGFSVTLLEGVTGSGKTEVYFESIAACLRQGKQALVLLPEIALSAQFLARFEQRFGCPPATWHSEIGEARRRDLWRAVARGEARVVVGARSALFLPYPNLGLIVVDEEHDHSFKQDEGVIYQGRDMAVARGHLGGHPVVLASATPSLETAVNVEQGRYRRLHLADRHGGAELPEIATIDLRTSPPPRGRWLSPQLVEAVTATLAQGEQAMLFLNRRGYAPLTLCRACGHRLQCPHCTAWLVEHRLQGRLQCHHCGFSMSRPQHCPTCEAEDSFAACGPGVERVAEEVAHLFPEARSAVMASDTLGGAGEAADLVRRMADRELDILIGTQIMAKGHHFPWLTLVGVVDADLGLSGGDLRASERTWQLLHQVAGRAGRAQHPGRVLLQTFDPANPVMKALIAHDVGRFLKTEAELRAEAGMPPFGRLVAIIVSGEVEGDVERAAVALGRTAPRSDRVQVLGPAPAPLALLRGRHRRRLLLKADRGTGVQATVARWLAAVALPPSVRIQVDVDPYSFM